jgi:hypothetical protein
MMVMMVMVTVVMLMVTWRMTRDWMYTMRTPNNRSAMCWYLNCCYSIVTVLLQFCYTLVT